MIIVANRMLPNGKVKVKVTVRTKVEAKLKLNSGAFGPLSNWRCGLGVGGVRAQRLHNLGGMRRRHRHLRRGEG